MSGCSRCESIDSYVLQGKVFLHIITPTGHTFSKLKSGLEAEFNLGTVDRGYLYLDLPPEQFDNFATLVKGLLSQQELNDSSVIMLYDNQTSISPAQALKATRTLASFVNMASAQWLVHMLDQNLLTIWFQPIVSSVTHEIYAHECLLRAKQHGKTIGAQAILSAAKEADMLFILDRHARINAINTASNHKKKLERLFINFNPTSIYDPQFCLRTTDEAVKKAQYEPEQIVFEITESGLVDDREHLVRITQFYRERGYRIALDDLGSGYSSLNMLHELNPDLVKLDMDLIRDIHNSPVKQIMVEKIIEIAQQMSIKTVAEGIETKEELECLKHYPIDYYQGYYFGKPAPI